MLFSLRSYLYYIRCHWTDSKGTVSFTRATKNIFYYMHNMCMYLCMISCIKRWLVQIKILTGAPINVVLKYGEKKKSLAVYVKYLREWFPMDMVSSEIKVPFLTWPLFSCVVTKNTSIPTNKSVSIVAADSITYKKRIEFMWYFQQLHIKKMPILKKKTFSKQIQAPLYTRFKINNS